MCVGVGVCGGVFPAMNFDMLRGMGLKFGMGVGVGPRGSSAYFQSDPTMHGSLKSSRGQVALETVNVMHSWGH